MAIPAAYDEASELADDQTTLIEAVREFVSEVFSDGKPIDPDRIPDGWELRHENHPKGPWPTGWLHKTDFWIMIWKKRSGRGAHLTIQPAPDGWRVEYDSENSWMGGDMLGYGFEFDEAIAVAIGAIERLNNGDDRFDIRFDYD